MWLEIETLTPVHLGTGDVLGPLDYALREATVGVADLGRLFRRDPARAEAIGQQLAGASPSALRNLGLERLLTPKELADETLWRYGLPASDATLAELGKARSMEHELRPATKTPDGRAYLPGTAIKGALRTALIFAWSAASPEWARRLLRQGKPAEANREVQSVLYGARPDPNHDLLRALMIGDTDAAPPAETLRVVHERVLSSRIRADRSRAAGPDTYKPFLVFLEALAPGTTWAASIRLLSDLLDVRRSGELGWSTAQRALNPQTLCGAANRMTAEICQWELEYFGLVQGRDCAAVTEFYRTLLAKAQTAAQGTAYLSIGRGAGWHKLTPGILVARHLSPAEVAEFRKAYHLAATDRFDRLSFVFPKSRKVVAEGERAVAPLGWVQLVFRDGQRPPRPHGPSLTTTQPTVLPEVAVVEETTPSPQSVPRAPERNPHVAEAESLIQSLKAREIKGRLQAIAEAIRRCPAEAREALIALFRTRQEELGLKPKDIKTNMESLVQRLAKL
jgi:CRISPR-associated protein Csm5